MKHAQDLEEAYAPESTVPSKTSFSTEYMMKFRTTLCYLIADVANTWPLDPTPSTMIEAMTTIKSAIETLKLGSDYLRFN